MNSKSYRYLKPGEKIQKKDQVQIFPSNNWVYTNAVGLEVPYNHFRLYRRKNGSDKSKKNG